MRNFDSAVMTNKECTICWTTARQGRAEISRTNLICHLCCRASTSSSFQTQSRRSVLALLPFALIVQPAAVSEAVERRAAREIRRRGGQRHPPGGVVVLLPVRVRRDRQRRRRRRRRCEEEHELLQLWQRQGGGGKCAAGGPQNPSVVLRNPLCDIWHSRFFIYRSGQKVGP